MPSSQILDNQGIVSAIDPQSTGTGIFNPFLREQGNAAQSSQEAGINTSINNPPYDTKADPHTHDLLVSSLATVNVGGTDYYKFVLDANQLQNGPISLIQFKVYVTTGSPFTTANDLINLVNTATPNYNMNGGATQYRVDISSQNGSGSGDMSFLVPKSDIGTRETFTSTPSSASMRMATGPASTMVSRSGQLLPKRLLYQTAEQRYCCWELRCRAWA